MRKSSTTNIFNGGLIMDLNPLTTPNNVLTDALNATLITYNGNEYALQNDMGNGRVETAYLPEGYIPLGTAELGGIIYIVSYNPLIKKCQIGSFPSPERIFLPSELQQVVGQQIITNNFYTNNSLHITSPYIRLILLDQILYPGDKFIVNCSNLDSENTSILSAYGNQEHNHNLDPRYLKLKIISIQDNGTITDLTDQLIWYDNDYYINDDQYQEDSTQLDIDEYRNLVTSNYNVFSSKVSGKLAVIAQLECIDTFSVAWNALKDSNSKWNIYLLLNWTYENEESRNKINLYGVYYNSNNESKEIVLSYPVNSEPGYSSTDILAVSPDTVFLNPVVSESNFGKIQLKDQSNELNINYDDSNSLRLNDGTDNQFILSTPVYTQTGDEPNNELTLEVYPTMPFGILDWLKQTFTIDLGLLGSGEIKLERYKYYVEDNIITLSYGISAYPELNKEVSSVQFAFYSINDDLVRQINEGINIDNVRYIKQINEEQEEVTYESTDSGETLLKAIRPDLESETPAYSFSLENQSSYSGNFTKVINKEDLGESISSAYLVEIAIDYNNSEKIYYYYRIMYTTDIFNSRYITVDDFSNIVLNDVLEESEFTTIENEKVNLFENIITEMEKSESDIETQIPSYQETQLTTNDQYYIKVNASISISYDLKYNLSVGQDTFDVTLTCGKGQNGVSQSCSGEVKSNNIQLTELDNLTSINPGSNEVTPSDNTITINSKNYTIKVPIYLSYDTPITVNVPYELVRAICNYVWLAVGGYDHECKFKLFDSWRGNELCSSGAGKDDDLDQSFSSYTEVYSYLQKLLDETDFLIVPIITYKSGKKGEEFTECEFHSDGDWVYKLRNNEQEQGSSRSVAVFYAMKRTNGDVLLFTFDRSLTTTSSSTATLFGESSLSLNYTTQGEFHEGDPHHYSPVAVLSSPLQNYLASNISTTPDTEENVVTGPYGYFNNYYKVVEVNSTHQIYQLTTVNYYDEIIHTLTVKGEDMPYNKSLKIKGTTIPLKSDLNIKNLQYIAKGKATSDYQYQNRISLMSIINRITTLDPNMQFVKVGNEYKQTSINPKRIYDKNFNILAYLKIPTNVTSSPAESWDITRDSKMLLSGDSGYIRVSTDYTQGNYWFNAWNEEQSIKARNAAKRIHSTDIY